MSAPRLLPEAKTLRAALRTLLQRPHLSVRLSPGVAHEFQSSDGAPLVSPHDVRRLINLGLVRMERLRDFDGWQYVPVTETTAYAHAGEQMAALATFDAIHRDPAARHRFGQYLPAAPAEGAEEWRPPATVVCAWQEPGVALQATAEPRRVVPEHPGVSRKELRAMLRDGKAYEDWQHDPSARRWHRVRRVDGEALPLSIREILTSPSLPFCCYAGRKYLGSAATLEDAKTKCETLDASSRDPAPAASQPTTPTTEKKISLDPAKTSVRGLRNGKIVILREGNPHKAGSAQSARYEVLRTCATVAEFLDKPLGASHMIHNLTRLGWIRIDEL